MGPGSVQAINQPAGHNTEAGFTVNVYTAGPSITGSRPHLPMHTEMRPRRAHTSSEGRHSINHAHLALSGRKVAITHVRLRHHIVDGEDVGFFSFPPLVCAARVTNVSADVLLVLAGN